MAVGALEKKFWVQTCDLLGKEEWKARYNDTGSKAEELRVEVAAVFASKTQDEWRDFFAETDCCVTPVLSPEKAFEHPQDRKSTRLNSSHVRISYAVFCLKKKKKNKLPN